MIENTNVQHEKEGVDALAWGVFIAILAAVFLLLAARNDALNHQSDDSYARNLERLAPIAGQDDLRVIFIGNSRFRYALTIGFDPMERVPLGNGRFMRSVQIADDGANYGWYQSYEPDILKLKPDAVVLLDTLITNSPVETSGSLKSLSDTIHSYVVLTLKGSNIAKNIEETRTHRFADSICFKEYETWVVQDRVNSTALRDRHDISDKNPNIVAARVFIEKLVGLGIPVIMVRLPDLKEVLDAYGVPEHIASYYGLGFVPTRTQILPNGLDQKVTWLDYPAQGKDKFCDLTHFNSVGRAEFTPWIVDYLKNIQ